MDPFLLQLVIVPIATIGAGILGTLITKKTYIGLLITAMLIIAFDYFILGVLISWCIILPIFSLIISSIIAFLFN